MQFGSVLTGLLGGLALFLYGMERLTTSLNSVAGSKLQATLDWATRNVVWGALTGAILTAILQSSSLTTVLCVGFISAGLMNLRQAVGVIVGANIGTTITAQVISLDVAALALPIVTAGIFLRFLSRSDWQRHAATVLFGVGMLFYGMELMSQATEPLRTHPPFIEGMKSLDRAWLGILVGAAFTALVQSSSATTGIVIVLGSQNFLSLEAAIALVLGANVGSCVTAVLAAWSRGAVARQAAAVHVVFNTSGALLWWALLSPLTRLTTLVSGAEIARQIANAHTIFNLSNGVIFMLLSRPVAEFVERWIPEEPEPDKMAAQPFYLDPGHLRIPSMALGRVRLELLHMGELAVQSVQWAGDSKTALKYAKGVHELQQEIVEYTRQIPRGEMSVEDQLAFETVLVVGDSLDYVALAVEELVHAEQLLGEKAFLSQVEPLHKIVIESLEQSLASLKEPELAEVVRERKETIRAARDEAMHTVLELLNSKRPGAAERYRHRAAVIDELRRVYYLATHIARAVQKEFVAEDSADEPKLP